MRNLFTTVVFFIALVVGHNSFAAISAYTLLPDATSIINQPMTVQLVISNTGASAVTLTNYIPTAAASANPVGSRIPLAFSQLNFGTNTIIPSVAANLTTTVPYSVVFFAPSTGVTNSGTGTYVLGGTVYTSDGSVVQVSPGAKATVSPIPLPAYERQ
jgi:hypothetical protein